MMLVVMEEVSLLAVYFAVPEAGVAVKIIASAAAARVTAPEAAEKVKMQGTTKTLAVEI